VAAGGYRARDGWLFPARSALGSCCWRAASMCRP